MSNVKLTVLPRNVAIQPMQVWVKSWIIKDEMLHIVAVNEAVMVFPMSAVMCVLAGEMPENKISAAGPGAKL